MAARHMGLVEREASKMYRRTKGTVERCDLVQDGWVGLRDAAIKFDPGRGLRFATYAARRIAGAMLDAIRARDPVSRLMRARGEVPRVWSTAATAHAYGDTGRTETLGDALACPRAGTADADGRDAWAAMTRGFDPAERLMLALLYREDMTMREAARAVGVCESRVGQVHASLLLRLRARLTDPTTDARRAEPW